MVKHVVFFKFKNKDDVDTAKDLLLSMKGKVPSVIAIEVHKNFLESARSYDLMLEVTVSSKASLEDYQADKYHCDVVKTFMHSATSASAAVDYEF